MFLDMSEIEKLDDEVRDLIKQYRQNKDYEIIEKIREYCKPIEWNMFKKLPSECKEDYTSIYLQKLWQAVEHKFDISHKGFFAYMKGTAINVYMNTLNKYNSKSYIMVFKNSKRVDKIYTLEDGSEVSAGELIPSKYNLEDKVIEELCPFYEDPIFTKGERELLKSSIRNMVALTTNKYRRQREYRVDRNAVCRDLGKSRSAVDKAYSRVKKKLKGVANYES